MEFDFKSGDIIAFCDEQYEVVENCGHYGEVKEYFGDGNYGDRIRPFYWNYQGEKCKIVHSK